MPTSTIGLTLQRHHRNNSTPMVGAGGGPQSYGCSQQEGLETSQPEVQEPLGAQHDRGWRQQLDGDGAGPVVQGFVHD